MKRFLQLLGEMKSYRLPTAKRALEELAVDDELVIVVPEQALAGEIQQWATSQGLTVAAPKKMLDGLARFQLSVKKAAPAPVEEKPAATALTPAAAPAPTTAAAPAAAPTPTAAPIPASPAP
jgi:TusA-related sulfurtransferase